jgi:ribosomal-protein-alanine N-acetyltransferase
LGLAPAKPLGTVVSHNSMQLRLQSCVIRPWSPDDAVAVQRYANNRKVWINLRNVFPHPYTLEDAHAFLRYVTGETPTTTFAIANPAEAIGCIGLQIGRDVHCKTAELGYWLGMPFWGRGIMSEAVAEFTRWAFETFDLERIYAEPFANNAASARVLEKAGFVCEGRLRARIFKDNQRLDSLLYARVEEAD